jgi:hypothetical protein
MTRRAFLVPTAVLLVALLVAWISVASAGSQEFVDDNEEFAKTLQAAGVLLLLWSLTLGAAFRSLTRAILLCVGGGAAILLTLSAILGYGYRTAHPDRTLEVDPAIGFRALGLTVLGVALGFAIGAVARRRQWHPGVVAAGVLAVGLVAEAVGAAIPTGRFQLSTHLVAWVAGDWIIYRPPSSCLGQDAATCGRYHATWQRSLPVLATLTVFALLTGWLASRRPAPAERVPGWVPGRVPDEE